MLLEKYNIAPVCADHFDYPMIVDVTADLPTPRLQKGSDDIKTCYAEPDMKAWGKGCRHGPRVACLMICRWSTSSMGAR